jgi:hypothetical protein
MRNACVGSNPTSVETFFFNIFYPVAGKKTNKANYIKKFKAAVCVYFGIASFYYRDTCISLTRTHILSNSLTTLLAISHWILLYPRQKNQEI